LARVPTIAADPPPRDHAALRPNAGPNGRASPRTRCTRELPAATRNLAPHAAKGVVISRPAEHGSGKLTSLYLGFLQAKHIMFGASHSTTRGRRRQTELMYHVASLIVHFDGNGVPHASSVGP
jgi:hypothetical protein